MFDSTPPINIYKQAANPVPRRVPSTGANSDSTLPAIIKTKIPPHPATTFKRPSEQELELPRVSTISAQRPSLPVDKRFDATVRRQVSIQKVPNLEAKKRHGAAPTDLPVKGEPVSVRTLLPPRLPSIPKTTANRLALPILEKNAEEALRSVGSASTTFTTPNPEDASTNLVWFLSTPKAQFVLKINSDPFTECLWSDGHAAQAYAELGFNPPSTVPIMGEEKKKDLITEEHPLIRPLKDALITTQTDLRERIQSLQKDITHLTDTPVEIFGMGMSKEQLKTQFKDFPSIVNAINSLDSKVFESRYPQQIKDEILEIMETKLKQLSGQLQSSTTSLDLLRNGKCIVMTMVQGQTLNEISDNPELLKCLLTQTEFLKKYSELVVADIFLGNTDRAAIDRKVLSDKSSDTYGIQPRIEGNNNNIMFMVENDTVKEMVPIDQGVLSLALYADFQGNQNLEKALKEYSATWDHYLQAYQLQSFKDMAQKIYNGLPENVKVYYSSEGRDPNFAIIEIKQGLKRGFEQVKDKGALAIARLEKQLETDLSSKIISAGSDVEKNLREVISRLKQSLKSLKT